MLKNNIFTYKFLPIIFLIFFILFIFTGNCFASIDGPFVTTDGYSYNTLPDLPSEISRYKYYLICNFYSYDYTTTLNNRVVLLYSNEPFYYLNEGHRSVLKSVDMCDLNCYYYIDSSNSNEWQSDSINYHGLWRDDINNAHFYYFDTRNPVIYISNSDVLYYGTEDVFFQVPPQEVILASMVEGMKMETTLQEIIQILPLILVVVVSLVGLRKGLALLLRVLHRCLIV